MKGFDFSTTVMEPRLVYRSQFLRSLYLGWKHRELYIQPHALTVPNCWKCWYKTVLHFLMLTQNLSKKLTSRCTYSTRASTGTGRHLLICGAPTWPGTDMDALLAQIHASRYSSLTWRATQSFLILHDVPQSSEKNLHELGCEITTQM